MAVHWDADKAREMFTFCVSCKKAPTCRIRIRRQTAGCTSGKKEDE